MNYKNILIIIFVVLWCLVIFYASSRTSSQSNGKSKKMIYNAVKEISIVTNKLKLTKFDLNDDKWINNIVSKINKPLRKCAHFTVYFILAILIMICFKTFNIELSKAIIITVVVCFLYSLTDEFHQIFVAGRTAQFKDCIIDTMGALIGSLVILLF